MIHQQRIFGFAFFFFFQEKVQHLQKAFASRVDKSTQTELLGYDVSSYIKPFFISFFIGIQTSTAYLPLLLLCPCIDLIGFSGAPFIFCS